MVIARKLYTCPMNPPSYNTISNLDGNHPPSISSLPVKNIIAHHECNDKHVIQEDLSSSPALTNINFIDDDCHLIQSSNNKSNNNSNCCNKKRRRSLTLASSSTSSLSSPQQQQASIIAVEKNQVQFSSSSVVHPFRNPDDIPYDDLWYSDKALKTIRRESFLDLQASRSLRKKRRKISATTATTNDSSISNASSNKDYCIRGLEEYESKKVAEQKRQKRKAVTYGVLKLQKQLRGYNRNSKNIKSNSLNKVATRIVQDDDYNINNDEIALDIRTLYGTISKWAKQEAIILAAQDAKDATSVYTEAIRSISSSRAA